MITFIIFYLLFGFGWATFAWTELHRLGYYPRDYWMRWFNVIINFIFWWLCLPIWLIAKFIFKRDVLFKDCIK